MKSWEVEEGAWKQERGAGTHAPCTGLQGVNFPELRAGGPQEDNAWWGWGADGSLTYVFTLRHLGCNQGSSPAFQGGIKSYSFVSGPEGSVTSQDVPRRRYTPMATAVLSS